jgi:hypothetical protein
VQGTQSDTSLSLTIYDAQPRFCHHLKAADKKNKTPPLTPSCLQVNQKKIKAGSTPAMPPLPTSDAAPSSTTSPVMNILLTSKAPDKLGKTWKSVTTKMLATFNKRKIKQKKLKTW